ncbi:uncharacterized protein [Nicotiana tomentosiformis]|uniref:uncharacterized protein n=1 Tax=Nicotiana tomentosiformis TaxID=4098 RepID=UPI00388C6D42
MRARPMHLTPPLARSAPARPCFTAIPDSTYCPPTIQGSSSGYSGQQGQASGQQSTISRGCFECGDLGHVKRFCPRLWGKAEQQDYLPLITAQAVTPAVWPPRGGGQVGRGSPRGRGQSGGALSRFYAFPARPEVVALDAVITCIISVNGRDATVLFDPRSTYSYVSSLFAHFLSVSRESLGTPLYVSMLVGDSNIVDQIYRSCIMNIYGYETIADLLLLDMTDFEVILGMEWLSPYHVILDCHVKTVTLAILELARLEWKGSSVSASSNVIPFLKVPHIVKKGCLAYLA